MHPARFVSGADSDMVVMTQGRTDGFDLKGGDATQGKQTTVYSGPRPDREIAGTCGGGSGGGKSIVLAACVAGSLNQTWSFLAGKDGSKKRISSGKRCLDIDNYGTHAGNEIWA